MLMTLGLLTVTETEAKIIECTASYYGDRFDGRRTASGVRFDMNAMTAAHRTLRFGTRVRVTNKANGRSVEVTINDRGPYIRGRSIDLSKAAARKIGMLKSGIARVSLQVLNARDAAPRPQRGMTLAAAQRLMIELF